MRGKGICYDTGFVNQGVTTHEPFDPERVRRDMRVIREELHCTAVRVTGGSVERLKTASTLAAEAGLEVWICPFTCDLTAARMLEFLGACAEHGEALRRRGAEVVMVTGSELSLANRGFVPGETFAQRAALFSAPGPQLREALAAVPTRVNAFLAEAVAVVRERFGGKLTYASLPFEGVDWAPFDIVATDAGYRTAENAAGFAASIRAFAAQDKPVAITEFGCVTYRGAAARGPRGTDAVVWDEQTITPLHLDDDYIRDEQEQADYLRESLQVFAAGGVDTAFAHVFACYHLPYRAGPRRDLDLGSAGVVKVLEDGSWEPKAAFGVLSEIYKS